VPEAKLYVIPGSHPSITARRMLELKGIPYKRVDLIPVVSKGVVRAQGFPGKTVPALKIDGRKVQGTREIARALDEIDPDPPLFPADANKRSSVEEAERWGDEMLQQKARRISWWALKKDRAPMASFSEGAKLGVPVELAVKTGGPIVSLSARFNEASDENVRSDLASLPADLDRIDAWISDGVLDGDTVNAADLQIAGSLRLLMAFDDLRPPIESRPAGKLALRAVPEFPGKAPAVFPPEWLRGFSP
jgi:glutathione S-transferase